MKIFRIFMVVLMAFTPIPSFAQRSTGQVVSGATSSASAPVNSAILVDADGTVHTTGTGTITGTVNIQGVLNGTPAAITPNGAFTVAMAGTTGMTVVSTGSTTTFQTATSLVTGGHCNNQAGSAVTLAVTNGTNQYYVGPSYSIPANSNLVLNWDAGFIFTSGIHASASATGISCQFTGFTQ